MASGVALKQKDNGAAALVKRMADAARKRGVHIGVFEQEAARDDGSATNVDVASFAEFGTAKTPARPWLSSWYDGAQAKSQEALKKIGIALAGGAIPSVTVGLERFGLLSVGEVQRGIRAGIPPPNADSTVEQKGSSIPLIDSGQFFTSITYRVDE